MARKDSYLSTVGTAMASYSWPATALMMSINDSHDLHSHAAKGCSALHPPQHAWL